VGVAITNPSAAYEAISSPFTSRCNRITRAFPPCRTTTSLSACQVAEGSPPLETVASSAMRASET
jgi:hypothetical protein